MIYVVPRKICGVGRRISTQIFSQILHVSGKGMYYCYPCPDQKGKKRITGKEREGAWVDMVPPSPRLLSSELLQPSMVSASASKVLGFQVLHIERYTLSRGEAIFTCWKQNH